MLKHSLLLRRSVGAASVQTGTPELVVQEVTASYLSAAADIAAFRDNEI
jgi:hypothetical protein